MYLVVIFIPFLIPSLVGGLLGFGARRIRSDILALCVAVSILLVQSVIMKRIGFNHEVDLPLFPQAITTDTILLLDVVSSISMSLVIPYIFARWGIELADRIRFKTNPTTRQHSKGNLILGIMLAMIFAASMVHTISITATTVHEAREKVTKHNDMALSSGSTSNTAPDAIKAVHN